MPGGEVPGDDRAPVVAHQMGRVQPERVEHGAHVRHALLDPVRRHVGGPGAGRVAALVEGVRAQPGGVQFRDDLVPFAAVLREAVQQQHRLTVGGAAFPYLEPESTRIDQHESERTGDRPGTPGARWRALAGSGGRC